MSKKNKNEDKKFIKDLQQVQDQYLDYPYPMRNPEDEKVRLICLQADFLEEINHYLFNGRQDFKNNFRVLVAGAGTGDAVIFHAEQLRDTNAQIVYLDFSKASMAIAKERAKIKGLKNIKWLNDSILNIPKLNIGKFDYINCVGVLHHLESPDEGFKALKSVLKPDGGMSIMVYAKYGRTGLYQVQTIMQMINEGEKTRQKEVNNGWEIVNALPSTNWYKRGEELLQDHNSDGDIGMYDMFLHKQDRAYSIPEMYEFISNAGLHFVEFSDPISRGILNIRSFLNQGELMDKILKMDEIKQQSICEIMAGNIIKHSFWVTNRSDSTIASFEDLDNVPLFYKDAKYAKDIIKFLDENPDQVGLPITFDVNCFERSMNVMFMTSPLTKHIFTALIAQTRSLGEILDFTKEALGREVTIEEFNKEISNVLKPLAKCGSMCLKHKSIKFSRSSYV